MGEAEASVRPRTYELRLACAIESPEFGRRYTNGGSHVRKVIDSAVLSLRFWGPEVRILSGRANKLLEIKKKFDRSALSAGAQKGIFEVCGLIGKPPLIISAAYIRLVCRAT